MHDVRIVHNEITPDIVFLENNYLTLVIENKQYFYKYVSELRNLIDGNPIDNSFSLMIDGSCKPLSKYAGYLFDLSYIDFNGKSIINMVIKKIGNFLSQGSQLDNKVKIESIVTDIMENFKFDSNINIEYDVLLTEALIAKMANISLRNEYDDLLEKIISYIDLVVELQPIKIFLILFAKEYLDEQKLILLNRHCIDKGCKLLLIESNHFSNVYSNEQLYIIDNDLCVIS